MPDNQSNSDYLSPLFEGTVPSNQEELEPSIVVKDLHKSYGDKKVLQGINFTVYPGELFGFIGKNGVGKSTTIDCIIGAKRFDSGEISIMGYDIKREDVYAKTMFGYVASEPTCYEMMTGYEYLEFIASIYHVSEGNFKANYHYLCKRLDFDEAELSNYISEYSHGMKQKLCLVASLIHNPEVWILDEPTVGLDYTTQEELKKMMREYADHGRTVFVTSHNIDLLAKTCDRVAIVNNGVVATFVDLKRNPNQAIQLPRIFVDVYESGGNE
ncbi:MAG: ABC transporter ATP-binding protein [Coprobacillus sp.]|nr:ABC transporter ATP-binding protein [Coprobacillus sp.]